MIRYARIRCRLAARYRSPAIKVQGGAAQPRNAASIERHLPTRELLIGEHIAPTRLRPADDPVRVATTTAALRRDDHLFVSAAGSSKFGAPEFRPMWLLDPCIDCPSGAEVRSAAPWQQLCDSNDWGLFRRDVGTGMPGKLQQEDSLRIPTNGVWQIDAALAEILSPRADRFGAGPTAA